MANKQAQRRRQAHQAGFRLCKSRARNPEAPGYGLYAILDPDTGFPVNPGHLDSLYGWTLEEVGAWLGGDDADQS